MVTGALLRYLYPAVADVPQNYVVTDGGLTYWNADALGPRPTDADLAAAAASPEYAEWRRTHGGDPAATLARQAADLSSSTEPVPLATAAGLELARRGAMDDRAAIAACVEAIRRIEAHLGLTPSVIEVPPQLTLEECEGLRRQVVAAMLGLPPMARVE